MIHAFRPVLCFMALSAVWPSLASEDSALARSIAVARSMRVEVYSDDVGYAEFKRKWIQLLFSEDLRAWNWSFLRMDAGATGQAGGTTPGGDLRFKVVQDGVGVVFEGRGVPAAEELRRHLPPSPPRRLEAFLKEHPEHWPTLRDLTVERIRQIRQSAFPEPGGKPQPIPERQWERLAPLLDRILGSVPDLGNPALMSFVAALGGTEEAPNLTAAQRWYRGASGLRQEMGRSPAIQKVFRRHWNALVTRWRKDPEELGLSGLLWRMAPCVGEPLPWEGQATALSPMNPLDPMTLPLALVNHAFGPSSEGETLPWMRYLWTAHLRHAGREAQVPEWAWSYGLQPYLRLLVTQKADQELVEVLGGLDGGWRRFLQSKGAEKTFQAWGRPELASLLAAEGAPRLRWRPLLWTGGRMDLRPIQGKVAQEGWMLEVGSGARPTDLPLLEGETWGLLAPDGRVVAKGEVLPTPEGLVDLLRSARVPMADATLRKRLAETPGSRSALRGLMNVLLERSRYLLASDESLREALVGEALALLERIEGQDLKMADLMPWVSYLSQGGQESTRVRESLSKVAEQNLQDLASRLERNPEDYDLWQAWTTLLGWAPKGSLEVLDRIHPSPLRPRMDLVEIYGDLVVEALANAKRNEALVRFALPRWKADPTPMEKRQVMGRARMLMEALLHLDRQIEADRIFRDLLPHHKKGLWWVVHSARNLGRTELADSWAEQLGEEPLPPGAIRMPAKPTGR